YKRLDVQQKTELFRNFGRIIVLDFLLGNTDRLVHLDWGDTCPVPQLSTYASNVGNLMLTPRGDREYTLYAIDNAVESCFVDSAQGRWNYSRFLESLFTKTGFERDIADALLKSIRSSTICMVDS